MAYENLRSWMQRSKNTAISRTQTSAPVRFLLTKGYVKDLPKRTKLDYGCGRSQDYKALNSERYDPYWNIGAIKDDKLYHQIFCTYVLNTLSREPREKVLEEIKNLLHPILGEAFITVRRDIPQEGTRTQFWVELEGPGIETIKNNSVMSIYKLTRKHL